MLLWKIALGYSNVTGLNQTLFIKSLHDVGPNTTQNGSANDVTTTPDKFETMRA